MRYLITLTCLLALFAVDATAGCKGGSSRRERRSERRMERRGGYSNYSRTTVTYSSMSYGSRGVYMYVPLRSQGSCASECEMIPAPKAKAK